MRILMVNYEYPPLGGGAGNATANLAREMALAGADVMVLTSAFRGLPATELANGVTIHRIPAKRRHKESCTAGEMLTFLGSALVGGLRLADEFRPDAAITFFGIPCGPVGLALKAVRGVPYIVSLRGGDVPGFQPYDLARYHWLLGGTIRFLWRRSHAVVANSMGLKELARQSAPDVPVLVIPNGVDTDEFQPLPDFRNGDGIRFGFCGRLVFQKGLDVLLRALRTMPREIDWSLVVVGDGPRRSDFELQAKQYGIQQRVEFVGWKSRSELPDLYRHMDLFVTPSRDEGMANALLEAMASGLPVVGTQVSGMEELIHEGETGLLVPQEDPDALAEVLRECALSPDLRRRMGRSARRLVETRYTWQKAALDYLSLVETSRTGSNQVA